MLVRRDPAGLPSPGDADGTRRDAGRSRRDPPDARARLGRPEESRLVDALRTAGAARCALVAEVDGDVVGHVCFSPVVVGDDPTFPALGLGPVAVLPAHQRRGIGAQLVREGLAAARGAGACAVVVLGEPDYYRRFGFTPARDHRLRCEYPGAEDAFMAVALAPRAFAGRVGLVRYRPEFAGV